MNKKKLLKRLVSGGFANVAFPDMVQLVKAFGFRQLRVNGSHHIFAHSTLSELVNLQEVKGEAKPYQVRQFLRLVERYNLHLEDET